LQAPRLRRYECLGATVAGRAVGNENGRIVHRSGDGGWSTRGGLLIDGGVARSTGEANGLTFKYRRLTFVGWCSDGRGQKSCDDSVM
jgi:hypothetical protein